MAKALFLSLPLHGHVNPSLPLVRELVERGESVVYYATDAFADKVERAGATCRRYQNAFLGDMKELPERMDALSWLLARTTAEVLGDELDAMRAERPDYVITDSVAPWGQWVAKLLGVPAVTSVSTFAFNRHVAVFAAAHGVRPKGGKFALSKLRHIVKALRLGRQLRRRYRVKGPLLMDLIMGHSELNIVYTSRYFQPREETFDGRYLFVGPSMAARTGSAPFPWDEGSRRAIVYVSLGTLFNTDAAFYRSCFEAFRSEDCQVIMSIGTAVSMDSLGPAPQNFIVQPHVPQLEVLSRATAFVTHGGMNSVSESLYHGVPVVVIPQMSEQHIVGRRVEQLGAGLYVAKTEVTADRVRDSVRRVIAEDRFRRQAALVGDSFRSAGGVGRAAEAILALTRPAKS